MADMRLFSTSASFGAIATALGAIALPGAALAQETQASGGRDAITVTAQRREESLQDVPIAISAFSEADLIDRQISEPLDLVNSVPNLIGSNNTGLGAANVYFIRGLGNTESIATFDPPVGTYVDDIYIARQNGNNVSFFAHRTGRGGARAARHAARAQHDGRFRQCRHAQTR